MSRQFYAAFRPYGIATLNTNGPRADVLLRFDSKAERDAWIAADMQHRESIAATATEVRAALRFEARERYEVIRTPAAWRDR